MTRLVRVIRVLEYVGTEDWIKHTMARNAVQGIHVVNENHVQEIFKSEYLEVPKVEEVKS